MATTNQFPNYPLAELHAHIGPSINPFVYWQIAHAQGFKLPNKDYDAFVNHITLSEKRKMKLDEYLTKIYHPLLDKLSSGTYALEKGVHEIMGRAYRTGITHFELRGNIMRHNKDGENDLDYIIMAMLHGMEKAFLEYPGLSGGLIFCLAREFSLEKNAIIIEKAIKYHKRGVVGLDMAGSYNDSCKLKDYEALVTKAKKAGLHVTIHAGETKHGDDMWEALEFLSPERIGHGIQAAYDKDLMKEIVKRSVVLEICPLSNLMTKAVENKEELAWILRTFVENNVKFTINTDWPETLEGGHLKKQYQMLLDEKMLSEAELEHCTNIAFESAFAKSGGLNAYL